LHLPPPPPLRSLTSLSVGVNGKSYVAYISDVNLLVKDKGKQQSNKIWTHPSIWLHIDVCKVARISANKCKVVNLQLKNRRKHEMLELV